MVPNQTSTDPTSQTFKLRFPEFQASPDALVDFAIEEALVTVGDRTDRARVPSILYLAAHILATNQFTAENGGRDLRHESLGRISLSYKTEAQGPLDSSQDLASTAYGRRYIRLSRMAIKPFQVVKGMETRINGLNSLWPWYWGWG